MKKLILAYKIATFTLLISFLISCEEEVEPPLFEFYGTLNEYELTTKIKSANVDTYLWDFGDGNTSTEKQPVHVYGKGGLYTVSLQVTGPGGQRTKEKSFEVAIPIEELLAGGPENTAGKTWVLSKGYIPGMDGAGRVSNDLPISENTVEEVLRFFGLGDEYEDEYTFYPDGTYKVDTKNGLVLAGILFGAATNTIVIPSSDLNLVSLCASSFEPPESGTWSLDYKPYTVDAFDVLGGASAPEQVTFTFEGNENAVARLAFSEGQYIGVLDLTPLTIIKKVTADFLHIAFGINVVEELPMHTCFMYHFTFTPKP